MELFEESTWTITEHKLSLDEYNKNESLMALSNGYLSLRGSFEEENIKLGHDGTYMNGFYEYHPIQYGEKFKGYPDQSQVMINLPDPKALQLTINDVAFSFDEGLIIDFNRELNMKDGTLTREIVWESPKKDQVRIFSRRFVSAIDKHLAAIEYSVTAINFEGMVTITSSVILNRNNLTKEDDPRVGVDFHGLPYEITETDLEDRRIQVKGQTKKSNLKFRCSVLHDFKCNKRYSIKDKQNELECSLIFHGYMDQYETVSLTKYMHYDRMENDDPFLNLVAYKERGFDALIEEHKRWWNKRWETMDIIIEGDWNMQEGIRFNMFHLTQNVGKDGYTNISAKGMTGEGYEGHYFWDTEIYIIPFFLYTHPEIARSLLEFRYHTLEQAKERAGQLGHSKGALYPWRTINGHECSSYYPAGTAQYHINADIAYAIRMYYTVTQDKEFMEDYGLEMLLEISNLWLEVGVFDEQRNGAFCINEVTGPDEYSCLVNNNTYTNAMARSQMQFTLECLSKDFRYNAKSATLAHEFDVDKAAKVVENTFLPYDSSLGIYAQDDCFLSKPIWDISTTPREKFPLLMHYHPLTLYRYQVCKQADVVLAEMLLSDQFTLEQKRRDFEYYEKITTHDSSLSTCIYGILASELKEIDHSYNYYIKTARTDLNDFHNNAKDGVHAANMAGSWMGIVYGFAGLRINKGIVSFAPIIPKQWKGFIFTIRLGENRLKVHVTKLEVIYSLVEGESLEFIHEGESFIIHAGKDIRRNI